MFPPKRYLSIVYMILILTLIFVSLRTFALRSSFLDTPLSQYLRGANKSTSTATDSTTELVAPLLGPSKSPENDEETSKQQEKHPVNPDPSTGPTQFDLPTDYHHAEEKSPLCMQRLGTKYLDELRQSRATYCSETSKSQLTCFHSRTNKSGRTDSFCIARSSSRTKTGFQVPCTLGNPQETETNNTSASLDTFPSYWYNTGPHNVMHTWVEFKDQDVAIPPSTDPGTFTVLIKREGAENLWHCLMEIMSLSMTFDVLQISPDLDSGQPFISPEDASNTQVAILDQEPDGPYFDLWRLFAKKSTVRLADLPADTNTGHLLIPLPGASNPVWQSDWEANDCEHSELLLSFSRRILKHYDIIESKRENDKIMVTFIARQGTRKLLDVEKHIEALNKQFIHAEARLVDLAAMSFKEQIQVVRGSDVLAGVHGAGLTHGMWLKRNSVMVEIMPKNFEHKGLRNLAGALGHGYFRAHGGHPGGTDNKKGWQIDDVAIEEERFVELMNIAVKSLYNRGRHDFDVLR